MYKALASLISEKLFTPTGIVVGIFVAIIAMFVFSNTDTILSGIGFETKINLKGELVKTESDLKHVKEVNEQLLAEIRFLNNENIRVLKALERADREQQKVTQRVEDVISERDLTEQENRKILAELTVLTDDTITMPIVEYDIASRDNIEAIHLAFNELFQDNTNGNS